MGLSSTDGSNPGRRQVQEYGVNAPLDGNRADHAVDKIGFALLKNCLIDKRLNAVLKRPGSALETIASGLGVPFGVGEFTSPANATIPIKRLLLFKFGKERFFQNDAGAYSEVSITSRCDFSLSRPPQFAQIGSKRVIASGLPAKWIVNGNIDRIGIVPPASPITIFSITPGTGLNPGLTLASGAKYMYTFFDSSTGLESDWSELSASTGPITNKWVTITIPSTTIQNYDSIRIYRTLDGGEFPYFLAQVSAFTTSYVDKIVDELLLEPAAERFDNAVPPNTSFLVAKYAQRFWLVDAEDQHIVRFSKALTTTEVDLEYFPVDNYIRSNEPITGLFVIPGKLLLFHPRNISYISGFSEDDFATQPYLPGTGTLFPSSISSNGEYMVFMAEQGLVAQPFGGAPTYISREIDDKLQAVLSEIFTGGVFVSSCWNVHLRQFLFCISAVSPDGGPWENVETGAIDVWEEVGTLTVAPWEDVLNPNISYSLKSFVWGWSPELSQEEGVWMEYTYPSIESDNPNFSYPIFVFHPIPTSDILKFQQGDTFLGFHNGTEGKIRAIMKKSLALDDATLITSELITKRIAPGERNGSFKIFHAVGFQNSYSDPTADGLGVLKYLIDFDDPHLRNYTPSLLSFIANGDMRKFSTTLARHVHLHLLDTSQSLSKILLSQFFIHYREKFRRGSR